MVTQPTPDITEKDIERVVRRDFPAGQTDQAFSILSRYGAEKWHCELERVRIAALKLAAGNLDRLSIAIAAASADYRDVLARAEYPEYLRSIGPSSNIPSDEQQRIIDTDWKRYSEWLERH